MRSGNRVLFFSRPLKLAEKAAVKFDAYQKDAKPFCGEYPFVMQWSGPAPVPKR